ncbi:MAG: flagellar filament capping protein FliD [Spirochaetes bacterium]|nr:flagellar filament capping protein FliD [Spirochaetota bacterium]
MPISISGMSSGLDTDGIIDKLVKVEREPIAKLEKSKGEYNQRVKALQELGKRLGTLNDAAKDLYGFRASFKDTKVTSSDDSIVEAKGSKTADLGSKEIQVLQLAGAHKITTDPVEREYKIPGGKFSIEVNGESASIKFKGGKLESLKETIADKASQLVAASTINTTSEKSVMVLESKTTGRKGEIKITGDSDLLKSIGLIGGDRAGEKDRVSLLFDQRYFTAYIGEKKVEPQDGSVSISSDGKTATIRGTMWREFILPVETTVKKDTSLEFMLGYKDAKGAAEEGLPQRIEFGPEESISVKGIRLHGYNVSRIREGEKGEPPRKFDTIIGVGIVAYDGGKRVEKLYTVDREAKGRQEIPIGSDFADKKISRVIFYCNRGTTHFGDAAIATPREVKDLLEPKNVITPAMDLKMKVDGIEVVRDRNTDINDIIPGVTLTVKGKSDRKITLKTEANIETSVDKIKKFTEAYNAYVELHRDLIKTGRITKPNERVPSSDRGLFIGDIMMMRLESSVKNTVNGAYQSRAERPVRVLAEMGISTGKINAAWESIKEGKLQVDESLLKKTISENPEGVTMFFGADNDGDNKIDGGMAYTLVNALRPYVSAGKNIIATKVDLENESIKMVDQRILRHEEHVLKYEDRLRRKFATMEQSLSKTKAQQEWMKNQMGSGGQGQK